MASFELMGQAAPGVIDDATAAEMADTGGDPWYEDMLENIPELPEGSAPWVVGGVAVLGAVMIGLYVRRRRRR